MIDQELCTLLGRVTVRRSSKNTVTLTMKNTVVAVFDIGVLSVLRTRRSFCFSSGKRRSRYTTGRLKEHAPFMLFWKETRVSKEVSRSMSRPEGTSISMERLSNSCHSRHFCVQSWFRDVGPCPIGSAATITFMSWGWGA